MLLDHHIRGYHFFIFILFERFIPQIFVTLALFSAVVAIFWLYYNFAEKVQQNFF